MTQFCLLYNIKSSVFLLNNKYSNLLLQILVIFDNKYLTFYQYKFD